MDSDWTPMEETDTAFLIALLLSMSEELSASAAFTTWPNHRNPVSHLDAENEANKQDQIIIEHERIERLTKILTSNRLGCRARPEDSARNPILDEVSYALDDLYVARGIVASITEEARGEDLS